MRGPLLLAAIVLVATAGVGCNLFGSSLPSGFDGWFHLDAGSELAIDIAFGSDTIVELRNLSCAGPQTLQFSLRLK